MTYQEFYNLCFKNQIPIADIKIVLEGYFSFDFNRLGIDGDKDEIKEENAVEIIKKMKSGYPAVYISGYDIIRGNKILLNENVLIPRTETIGFIYEYIKDNYDFSNLKILDLCTGSGFIAIALKSLFETAKITASDISIYALNLARKSAEINHKEINFTHSDFLNDIKDTFDVIISNPPYIEENSTDVDAPFEPSLALFSGIDGCDSYRTIFKDLDNHLNSKGLAFFELEASNAYKVEELLHTIQKDIFETEIILDMENKPRYLKAKKLS